ncbi:Ger(x)C family spore germination protein [Cytobacillus sp. Sa5YUA1]|uniref:Ger(X)C family spore germination protein n=1 Tax=Cytobacillus stercorigallinarum TaxID=2762240 RepID=A0ABR8QW43_9BACI|nr:Ger(x)C family spore germination protein [Cytobacillus stercorigallinarum]MBD7939746.1 Ger(x)C family spore germination protein [Cytobacillus stercorigallinarum]
MVRMLTIIPLLFLLTGCWSSQELDKSALVHGIGLDKSDGQLRISVEIIKPTGPSEQGGGEGGGGNGQNILLERDADSLIQGAREFIKDAKRRLYFEHTRLWVIGEELAKDNFIDYLDESRRDQMFRLNSYLFITEENPIDILGTSTLYEDLSSAEIVSALEQTQYIAEFTSVKIYEFYKLIEGPIPNAYLPIIKTKKEKDKAITSLDGTAVIRNDKMVGKLNTHETVGLNILLNKAKGGGRTVSLNDKEKVSLEIKKSETKIKPILNGNQLNAHLNIKIEGTLADNTTKSNINEQWISKVEEEVSNQTEKNVRLTLDKLQKELKTDISGIGLETYRKYPKQWQGIQSEWNEIFSNADIIIDVHTNITHQGLINKSINRNHKKPYNNPYKR